MRIQIHRDVKKYTLTSSLTKNDLDLVKKYRPAALKRQDEDGNDIFAMSFCEDRPCVAANGITFGSVSAEGGYAMIVGDLPEKLREGETYGEFIADKVGAALPFINEFELSIPGVATEIRAERAALIDGIVEV